MINLGGIFVKRLLVLFLLLSTVLPGCSNRLLPARTQPRLVTAITASYRNGVIELQRQYTDSEKMRAILNYFRKLELYGNTAGPESAEGSQIRVTLTYSDGTTKTYDQQADRFLRISGGNWQSISSEKGQELGLLLGLMESDEK